MQPFKHLFQYQRLRLSAPRPEDNDLMARWTEDGEFQRQMDTDFARPCTPANVIPDGQADRGPQNVYFHLRTTADDQMIGFIALFNIEWNNGNAVLAMGLGGPENRGQGYGLEALALMLNYAFYELNLHRVSLNVIGDNLRAIHAYEKAGFKEEGHIRQAVQRDGQRHDLIWMGILRDEWLQIDHLPLDAN